MASKSHLLFKNPVLGVETFKYRRRSQGDEEEEEQQPDYSFLSTDYQASLAQYNLERTKRVRERDTRIVVPANIFYIKIEFFGWFDSKSFENYYRTNFGLSPVKHYRHNTQILFSIVDETRFGSFIDQINTFISTTDHANPQYNTRLRYIKSFELLSTDGILSRYSPQSRSVTLCLVDNAEIFQDQIAPIESRLLQYLNDNGIRHRQELLNNTIEVYDISEATVLTIARNFDVIHSVSAVTYGVIGPSAVGVTRREYPFTVRALDNSYPSIGILDTGVSNQTPLSTILINSNNDFGVSGSDPRVDAADHGTAVAGFAVLGSQLAGTVGGELNADARILSIKILDGRSGTISVSEVQRLIRKAHADHGTKLFVLTICFTEQLSNDSAVSEYAFLLDKLSYELDVLIFISTGNNTPPSGLTNGHVGDYPRWFLDESSNLCSPSESMNNITLGAIGDNLEPERTQAITIGSLPAIYTRTYHIVEANQFQKNKLLFKPDAVYCGGNYEYDGAVPTPQGESAMQVLSSDRRNPFVRFLGTSYSGPLIANFAAKILRQYPDLRLQTVKALILNSCDKVSLTNNFTGFTNGQKRFVVGNGKPNLSRCLFSNDNEATLVLEDSIVPGNFKSFELKLPDYLNTLEKDIGLIEVNATLCFKFHPLQNNHIAYCPIHMGFGFFKDVALSGANNFLNNNTDLAIKKGLGWSQDAFYKSKMYSNSQKVRFTISRTELIDRGNKFKIAVNCRVHNILPAVVAAALNHSYDFSLVIRIREQLVEDELTNQLYAGLEAVNSLEVVSDLEAEAEGEI